MKITITDFGDWHTSLTNIEADVVQVLWGENGACKDFLMNENEIEKFVKKFSWKNKVNGLFDLIFDDITSVDFDNKTAEIVINCHTKKDKTFLVSLRNLKVVD